VILEHGQLSLTIDEHRVDSVSYFVDTLSTSRATTSLFDHTLGIHPTAAEEFVTMRTPVVQASKDRRFATVRRADDIG